jgi:hypothetical protein
MRPRPSAPLSTTRRGDKEQRLREFILGHLAHAAGRGEDRAKQFLVIARSVESPVVTALTSLEREIAQAGYSVRLILAQAEHDTFLTGRPYADEVRWARHPRLIEAHEQLVLGPETCWIGDCMRRDPTKSDAFENYVEDCGEAAGCAAVSFERLWFASEPVAMPKAQTAPSGREGAAGSINRVQN